MPTTLSRLWGALALLVLSGPLGAASDAAPTVKRLDRNTVQAQGVRVSVARYAVRIKSKPTGPLRWDLYNPLWGLGDAWGNQDIIGQESVTPYRRHQRQALITCQLRQYDEMEENVVFTRAGLSPGGKRNALPASPLYRRHRVPMSVRVDVAAPVFMSSNSGDSTLPQITLSLRDSKATYLASLALVVHQRADLQSIPLAFQAPIARRVPQELFAGLGG